MLLNSSFRSGTKSTRRRRFSAARLVLAALCFLALPAWPQDAITCGGDQINTGNFYLNFANSNYEYPLSSPSGTNANGDLNSKYYQMFYSIANATSFFQANGCNFELVIVGALPDARYFSITDNDMHFSETQHLADADIDPIGGAPRHYRNSFIPLKPYNGSEPYLVPVSLGSIPASPIPGCAITPFEEDNLLDATQRHPSMDWNTDLLDLNNGVRHVADTPEHATGPNNSGPNTAGSILVRNYLLPETCTSSGGTITCIPANPAPQPYVIVRDTVTGCAYPVSFLTANGLVNDPTATPPLNYPTTAIVSTVDAAQLDHTLTDWNDERQHQQHTYNADLTPEACYANGDAHNGTPPFPNDVAWVRSQEWVGSPGPDDSYIGTAVPGADLKSALPTVAGGPAQYLLRFRFQLPNMPKTPCPWTSGNAPCSLSGSEQLRYMSLTFGYQTATQSELLANPDEQFVADPDGLNAGLQNNPPVSIVSLADLAFAQNSTRCNASSSSCYVTLLVNVGGTLPTWLQQANATGLPTQGFNPPTPTGSSGSAYSVWWVNGYTVLDLSQFTQFTQNVCSSSLGTCLPLLVNIRNTLPSTVQGTLPAAFNCSGAAVPFSTAVYTNLNGTTGSSLMGPYVPLVDYPNPFAQNFSTHADTSSSNLPSATYCGQLPTSGPPSPNSPALASPTGSGCNPCVNYPTQYWPQPGTTSPPNLVCGPASSPQPTGIYFVATQRTSLAPPGPQGQGGCAFVPPSGTNNPCTQIVAQSPQMVNQAGSANGWLPPMPLKIVGSGFGFLPQTELPLVLTSSSYLDIVNDGASGAAEDQWDSNTSSCQFYIANWTDSSISVINYLPPVKLNGEQTPLSPLTDFSFLTFFTALPNTGSPCPVQNNDKLTFTVTNPQSPATIYQTQPIQVYAAGTTPN